MIFLNIFFCWNSTTVNTQLLAGISGRFCAHQSHCSFHSFGKIHTVHSIWATLIVGRFCVGLSWFLDPVMEFFFVVAICFCIQYAPKRTPRCTKHVTRWKAKASFWRCLEERRNKNAWKYDLKVKIDGTDTKMLGKGPICRDCAINFSITVPLFYIFPCRKF